MTTTKAVVYPLKLKVSDNIFKGINTRILNDFEAFRKEKKLKHCTLRQEKPVNNTVHVTWTIIQRYDTKFVDVKKLERELRQLNQHGDRAYIANINCQSDQCEVQFVLERDYEVEVTA